MAFGPIMRFTINDLTIELAPLVRESVGEFVNIAHGGGMQRHSVSRFLARRNSPVLEDEYEWYDRVRLSKEQISWGIWHIEGDARTIIGTTALRELGVNDAGYIRQAENGSVIFRPEYWGKGIGSAVHKARTWYAFTQLGIHRVHASVVKGNKGSSKALSRSGYTLIYTSRNNHFVDGKMHHEQHFECINPYDTFWDQWWGSDEAPSGALEARLLTREAMSWAERNVTLT